MADVSRGNRPLSPHLEVYRWELGMAMSIFHRATGCGLAGAAVLIVWWFAAAASGAGSFETANWLLGSWIGGLVFILSLLAFWYHLLNGVRHLVWDAGRGFDLAISDRSGQAILVAAVVLTIVTVIAV